MKKVLSLVLALALLLGVPAFAEEEEEQGTIQAAPWAVTELERAWATGVFPEELDPYRDDCTRGMIRAEFAAITVRIYELLGGDLHKAPSFQRLHPHPFTDIDNYDYDIREAYGLGFVKGVEADTFDPNGTLTREQACAMLGRVYEKLYGAIPAATATSFADDELISSYAKAAVAFLAANGVTGGVGNNEFDPKSTLTVQEAVMLALRMVEKKDWANGVVYPVAFDLTRTDLTLYPGDQWTLHVKFTPEDAAGKVTWSSKDPSIATVSEEGLVVAVAPGVTTVTATVEGLGSKSCIVRCAPDPWETGEPDETEEPTETGEPTENEEPSETEEPTESEGPAETGEPEEGTEPGGEELPEEETEAVG